MTISKPSPTTQFFFLCVLVDKQQILLSTSSLVLTFLSTSTLLSLPSKPKEILQKTMLRNSCKVYRFLSSVRVLKSSFLLPILSVSLLRSTVQTLVFLGMWRMATGSINQLMIYGQQLTTFSSWFSLTLFPWLLLQYSSLFPVVSTCSMSTCTWWKSMVLCLPFTRPTYWSTFSAPLPLPVLLISLFSLTGCSTHTNGTILPWDPYNDAHQADRYKQTIKYSVI